jgi:transcription elongation factor Elf1
LSWLFSHPVKELKMLIPEVTFQDPSKWLIRNRDCLFCGALATKEAYLHHKLGAAYVRCCANEVCKINASLMAVQIYNANEKRLEKAKV